MTWTSLGRLTLLAHASDDAVRALHEAAALELYRRRAISAGRAAALLGMDKFAFIRWWGELGIPFFRMDPGELERDLDMARDFLRRD